MLVKRVYIRENNHWVCDENLMLSIARFKRLTGKLPTEKASIVCFEGKILDVEKIRIDEEMGAVQYPINVKRMIVQ